MKNIIKYLKKIMPFFGIIFLIYIIINIGIDKIVATFLQISFLHIIIAASLTLPRVLLRNIQWQILLKKQRIFIGYFASLKIFLIGYFYGVVTPGYLGLLMRIPYLKERTDEPLGKLFVNCFMLSAVNSFVLYGMAVIGAFLIIDLVSEALPITVIALMTTIVVYWIFIKKERGERILKFFVTLTVSKKLQSLLTKFSSSFYRDFPNIKDFIVPVMISIPVWIIMYSQIYILGIPIGIKQVPYFTFILFYAIGNIVAFIPITTAGLGTREATLILLFSFYEVTPQVAVVVSLAGHILTDVLTGIYGFIISIFEAKTKKGYLLSKNKK